MTDTPYPLAPRWVTWGSRGLWGLPKGRYVLMNWFCRYSSARPFQRPLGVTGGSVRFICDWRDGIAREACFMGYYEPQETVLVRRLLRPGMTFVDAGASWGAYTLLAAHLVGPAGSVVAFEPHPELYRRLEENVTINRFDHVAVVEAAVAGESCTPFDPAAKVDAWPHFLCTAPGVQDSW